MSDENRGYPKGEAGRPIALEARSESGDGRRFSPSIARNRDAVCEAFGELMPTSASVLEIASGTGEHGAYLSAAFTHLKWTYSDIDPDGHVSQSAWVEHVSHDRLSGPLTVDAAAPDWVGAEDAAPWDAMFCANMIHIAPFEAAQGLLAGAGRLLAPAGRMMLYGPFARRGGMAPSNARFSADLKRRDPAWGVRDLDDQIVPLAEAAGLELAQVRLMPANNLCVVFERPA